MVDQSLPHQPRVRLECAVDRCGSGQRPPSTTRGGRSPAVVGAAGSDRCRTAPGPPDAAIMTVTRASDSESVTEPAGLTVS